VVVDGVRHRYVYHLLLERAARRRVVLICVDADVATRRERLRHDGLTGSAVEEVLVHSTEVELPWLRAVADMVADGTGSSEPVLAAMRAMMADGRAQNSR
jgi:dephospho-CoA kinase